MSGIGIGLIIDRRYDEAIDNCRNMMRIDPNYGPAHRQLCAALALAGKLDDASMAMGVLLRLMPALTVSKVIRMIPVQKSDDNDRWIQGLRLAGLAIRYANSDEIYESFEGDSHAVQEYLLEEILSGLEPDICESLRKASIYAVACHALVLCSRI